MTKTFTSTILVTSLLALATSAAAQTPPARPAGQVSPPFTQPIPPAGLTPTMKAGTTRVPSYDLSFGYQVLNVPDQTFPFGLNADGAKNFGPLGIAAEIGWALKSSDENFIGTSVKQNELHFAAGPRWTGRSSASIWPFAQVLAGGAYRHVSAQVAGLDFSDSKTRFMLQPGAGLVFLAGDGWGIVGQVDYRRVFLKEAEDGDTGENDFRTFIGIRVILD